MASGVKNRRSDTNRKSLHGGTKHPLQLRQAAALHHARYRGGFHSAASLAAAQAGMKFAVAHNIPAFLILREHLYYIALCTGNGVLSIPKVYFAP